MKWLKIIISGSLFLFILTLVDIDLLLKTLKSVDFSYLILVILLYLSVYFVLIINAYLLFKTSAKVKFLDFASTYFLVFTVSEYTPGKLGDFSLAIFLKKYGANSASVIGLVFLDKIINLLAWICFLLFSLYLSFDYFHNSYLNLNFNNSYIYLFILLIIISLLTFLIFRKKILNQIFVIKSFFRQHFWLVILNFSLTILKIFLHSLTIYYTFEAFGIKAPYLFVILGSSLVSVIGVLPISLNSIGLREAIYSFIYPLIGVSVSSAVAVSIATPVISIISKLILLSIFILFLCIFGVPIAKFFNRQSLYNK